MNISFLRRHYFPTLFQEIGQKMAKNGHFRVTKIFTPSKLAACSTQKQAAMFTFDICVPTYVSTL